MTTTTPLIWNLFDEPSLGLRPYGLWRHPDNQRAAYDSLERWSTATRIADRAGFTSMFLVDALGIYDVYGGSPHRALAHAVEVPILDPMILASTLVGATEHLGFIITGSTTYEHPFAWARRMSTLDALSHGRVGWNVVTSYLDSAARNFGITKQPDHDARYERAEEFFDVCLQLWEDSWEDAAVLREDARIRSIDPGRVHNIDHAGERFDVAGPHLVAPTPQRTPVIAQAGASSRGLRFAGEHAEMVFVQAADPESVARSIARIGDAVEQAGRPRGQARPVAGLLVILGESDQEARRLASELSLWHDATGDEISFSASTGVDFSRLGADDLFPSDDVGRSVQSSRSQYGRRRTVGDIRAAFASIDNGLFCLVGSPVTVADGIADLVERTGVAGFNLYTALTPSSLTDVVDMLVPELRTRGLFPQVPTGAPATLRERLPGTAGPHYHHASATARADDGTGAHTADRSDNRR